MTAYNFKGQRFGRWLVLQRASSCNRNSRWDCRCDCGTIRIVYGNQLKAGRSRSCGCLQRELVTETARRTGRLNRTHGGSGTPEYHAFVGARGRCLNPLNQAYINYGGRGIEFRFGSFEDFFKEVGPRPAGMTLDRKDNNGHYEPGNVRWATRATQTANRRIKRIEHFAISILLAELARRQVTI